MTQRAVQTRIIVKDAVPYVNEDKLAFPSLSCQVQASDLTCLVGPHRSQLRAYLLMLAGIFKPAQGDVEIMGQKVSELDRLGWRNLRRQVGYVSGGSPVLSTQHGLMNVMLPLLYHENLPFRETADKARALLDALGCDFEPTHFPAMLNSLQRSQLALARALILNPPLLFLDVPFNNLGAKEREKMGMLLGKYTQNRVVCMIGGLQYPHFLEQYAKQIVFISEQKVMRFNSWNSFSRSEDLDVQQLLGFL